MQAAIRDLDSLIDAASESHLSELEEDPLDDAHHDDQDRQLAEMQHGLEVNRTVDSMVILGL